MNQDNHDTVKSDRSGSSWSRFWSRFAAEPKPSIAHQLYDQLVRHARFPLFYNRLDVPDTPEGRFEILALHVALTVRKLCNQDEDSRVTGQALFDLMIADIDMNLRELGVGDLSVGKQVKRMASQFYARLAVLNEVFDQGTKDALSPMLQTNVYGAVSVPSEHVTHLACIILALQESLERQQVADLTIGKITLPDEQALLALINRDQASGSGK